MNETSMNGKNMNGKNMNGNSRDEALFFHTEQLAVGYGKTPLLHKVRIELKRGSILTLLGPNGVGKSTLLRTIANQLTPLGGCAYLDGELLSRMSEKETAERVSLVLTDRIQPELMTCREVVAMGRYPYTGRFGRLTEKDWEKVDAAMELVCVSELGEQDFMTLSDGQKQRIMLARALCQEPKLLILDEPTSYLDIRYKLEFLSILQRLTRESALTVIMSLHELELAQRVSDQILCIKGAYVDRIGTPEQIFTGGYIKELYDMPAAFFDERFGIAELIPVAKGEPEIFVIAGGGSGISLYRRLQRSGISFATGILWENDIDYLTASALAERVISEKAFCEVTEETKNRALTEMQSCRYVISCISEFGALNAYNQELLCAAAEMGKLIDRESLFQDK